MLKVTKKFLFILLIIFSSLSVISAFLAIERNSKAQEINQRIDDNSTSVFSWNIVYSVSEIDYLNSLGLKYNQKSISIYSYIETYSFTTNQESYLRGLSNTCLAAFNNIFSVTTLSYFNDKELALNGYSNCYSWEKDRGSVFSFEINTPNDNVYKISLLETLVQFNSESDYYTVRRLKIQENDTLIELGTTELLYDLGKTNYLKFSSNINLKSSYNSKASISNDESQRINLLVSLQADLSLVSNYELILSSLSIFFGIVSTFAIFLYLYMGKFQLLKDAISFHNLRKKKNNILKKKAKLQSEALALSKLKDLEKELENLK